MTAGSTTAGNSSATGDRIDAAEAPLGTTTAAVAAGSFLTVLLASRVLGRNRSS